MMWFGLVTAVILGGCNVQQTGWSGDCRLVDHSTDWHRLNMTIPTRNYRSIRLYLRLQHATGSVWFDRVEAPGLAVANPSFEKADGNDIAGWQQDDVGKTIFSDDSRAYDGRRCVRIFRSKPGMSRIWQDLRVEPGKRYKIHVWAQWAGIFGGNGYGEVYGINPDGTLGGILGSTERLSGSSSRVFARWWEMSPHGKVAIARLSVPVAEPSTYEIVVPVHTGEFNGTLLLQARGAEGVVSQAKIGTADDWQAVRLCVPASKIVKLTAQATGRGTVRLRQPQLQHIDITPMPQQVRWHPPQDNFPLRGPVTIVVPPDAAGRRLTGPKWLAREIKIRSGADVKIVRTDSFSGRAIYIGGDLARKKLAAASLSVPNKPEGYALAVRRDFVAAAGHDERGTFYATVTLLWLIQKIADHAQIVSADIVDWPALPLRATYGIYGGRIESAAEVCARLKLNALIIEHGDWYHLDNLAVREKWQKAFAVASDYYIDIIPELQSFGHAGVVLSIDPRCAEAEWIRNEKHTLRGSEPVQLAHHDVIVTEATSIEVTSADGKIQYVEGKDFRVIEGETAWPFSPKHRPWAIARIPGGRIPDGATVLVSYDCAPKRPSSYCPNEPLVYKIMGSAIQNTLRFLKPRYLHIGHDEIPRMNADSRCKRAGRSNAQNLAMELKRLLSFARQIDPKIQLMLWADMLNPYHNGVRYHRSDPTYPAAELIPADGFIMNVWFYGATQPLTVGWESLQWFAERGFATTGSPWYNHTCAALWGDVCGLARRQGLDCVGVLYTSWSGRWQALATCADHAWHPRSVSLPSK